MKALRPQDKSKVSESKKMSDMAIRETLRLAVPQAIARLVELLQSKNQPVALGAAKIILSKVIPDLRSIELTDKDGAPLPIPIFQVITQVNQQTQTTDAIPQNDSDR